MAQAGLLQTVAQLALGFAGIILAIARRSGEPTDQISVRVLFQSSLGALFSRADRACRPGE